MNPPVAARPRVAFAMPKRYLDHCHRRFVRLHVIAPRPVPVARWDRFLGVNACAVWAGAGGPELTIKPQ
jgi:hypothetical protein